MIDIYDLRVIAFSSTILIIAQAASSLKCEMKNVTTGEARTQREVDTKGE